MRITDSIDYFLSLRICQFLRIPMTPDEPMTARLERIRFSLEGDNRESFESAMFNKLLKVYESLNLINSSNTKIVLDSLKNTLRGDQCTELKILETLIYLRRGRVTSAFNSAKESFKQEPAMNTSKLDCLSAILRAYNPVLDTGEMWLQRITEGIDRIVALVESEHSAPIFECQIYQCQSLGQSLLGETELSLGLIEKAMLSVQTILNPWHPLKIELLNDRALIHKQRNELEAGLADISTAIKLEREGGSNSLRLALLSYNYSSLYFSLYNDGAVSFSVLQQGLEMLKTSTESYPSIQLQFLQLMKQIDLNPDIRSSIESEILECLRILEGEESL